MTYALRTASGILSGLAASTPAAVRPLATAAAQRFNAATAPGAVWVATGTTFAPEARRAPQWRREDVPLAYLTRDGVSGAFTAYDGAGAVLRDTPGSSSNREGWSTERPPTAPRAPAVLEVATLAASYVGQAVVVLDAGTSRWLPATVLCDGDTVLMPAGAPVPAALPASTPAAELVDARDGPAPRSLRVFRRTGGGLVLGAVDLARSLDASPSEAFAVTAVPSTLGALAPTARDGRTVAVNVDGTGDRATWVLLRWA